MADQDLDQVLSPKPDCFHGSSETASNVPPWGILGQGRKWVVTLPNTPQARSARVVSVLSTAQPWPPALPCLVTLPTDSKGTLLEKLLLKMFPSKGTASVQ